MFFKLEEGKVGVTSSRTRTGQTNGGGNVIVTMATTMHHVNITFYVLISYLLIHCCVLITPCTITVNNFIEGSEFIHYNNSLKNYIMEKRKKVMFVMCVLLSAYRPKMQCATFFFDAKISVVRRWWHKMTMISKYPKSPFAAQCWVKLFWYYMASSDCGSDFGHSYWLEIQESPSYQ